MSFDELKMAVVCFSLLKLTVEILIEVFWKRFTPVCRKEKNHVTPLQVSPYFTHKFINPKESTFCRSIILQWQQRSRQSTSNKFDISPLADKCVSCFSRQRYAQLNGKWSPWEPISGPQPTHVGITVRARVWCSTPFENQMPAGALSSRVWQRKSVLFPNGNGKKHISHIFERIRVGKKTRPKLIVNISIPQNEAGPKKSRRPYKRPSQSVSSSSPKPLPTAATTTTPAGFGLDWSPGKYAKKRYRFSNHFQRRVIPSRRALMVKWEGEKICFSVGRYDPLGVVGNRWKLRLGRGPIRIERRWLCVGQK